MRAATAFAAGRAAVPGLIPLRRAILTDHAGNRLGEVPLEPTGAGGAPPLRDVAAAQVLVAVAPNGSDRPATGDAMQVVIGRRACFGYFVDAAHVRWFSHPRLTRADALSALDDRGTRRWLYDLHAADPETVPEIIWETSGRIFVRRAPALPAGIDPRAGGSPERERESAAYLSAIVRNLLDGAPAASRIPVPDPAHSTGGRGASAEVLFE